MKNPLRKRHLRELKSDFGKYLAIALFMIMLIGLVSGYLVSAVSIEKTFYEGWEKYNIEDGHITFSLEPDGEVLKKIEEKACLKFYDLQYFEEDIDDKGTTIRVFKNRTEVDGGCLWDGELPQKSDEIAIDRIFANNNNLAIGDYITLNGNKIKVSGFVALVDYNCLFENNTDMMFNASLFGVGVMTEEGYETIESKHLYHNYAWKYDAVPKDETEENEKSEELIDVLEDVIVEYDETLIQAEVDELYKKANTLSTDLNDEFENVQTVIGEKTEQASKDAAQKAIEGLSDEDKISLYMRGATSEEYFAYAVKKQNTSAEELVAGELGTTLEALNAFKDAAANLESDMDDLDISGEAPRISLDAADDKYENDLSFSMDSVRDVVDKLEATGLYDVSTLNDKIDELETLTNYQFDENKLIKVDNYVPKYQNKSITYCMDDMSSDKPMFIIFDYIIVVILAFVFAVTISATIQKEAGVIGTLRASGYTRAELVGHYLFMPVLVTILAAIVGNILGYTVFVNYMKNIFYNSFSLARYESVFDIEALVDTTIIPLILMIFINLYMLIDKLKISPIRFLRRDLAKKKKRRAMILNKKISFLHRFRLRILFQNISVYITLMFGIFLGSVIAVFGFMFGPLLVDYADMIAEERICDYQYVLMNQNETDTEGAEKYCIEALNLTKEGYLTDEISVYGIAQDSCYITKDIPEGSILASEGILEKYKLAVGDSITLKDLYGNKTYNFLIADEYKYSASLAIFMNKDEFNETFGESEDHFTGYFSNEEIKDIEAQDIATVITESDLTKVSDQMIDSIGQYMSLFKYFGAIMLALLMYLMTKQVIEKNAQSIAMTKILGFRNNEIFRLYVYMSGIVVLVAYLLTVPLTDLILRWMFSDFLYKELSGYIPYIVSNSCYVYTFIIGGSCFVLISICMFLKIGKIEKSEALKNVE